MDLAWLDVLNAEQRRAATHGAGDCGEAGPLLIIAGAGTGKTNTLAHRVAYLVAEGADPRRILLLTFSRRAAAELSRRVERIVAKATASRAGTAGAALAWSGTFHAVGARLLRAYAERIGISPSFTIHDREDSADLMNLVRHDLGFSGKDRRFPGKGTCLQIYSRAVNAEAGLEEVLGAGFPWCAAWEDELRALFRAYVDAKQRQNVLDYDDLLLYWAQLMAEPALAADVAARFDHVLVDEYQDTNRLQATILLALKPDGRGVTAVGDDAQAIYSFRAATVRNILDFPASFSPAAMVATLERNYRSTQPILAAANAVIALAPERFTKDLRSERPATEKPAIVSVADEADQARCVVEGVLRNRESGVALKSQAVLFRTSHHSAALELELARADIPFRKYGGLKFLDTAHVKDVLACLRWTENPRDRIAGFRLLLLLPGLGPKSAARILDRVAESPDAVRALSDIAPSARPAAEWQAFVELIERLHRRAIGWPAEIAQVRSWYEPHLARLHDDAEARLADLAQLELSASEFSSRERFLTELAVDPPDAVSDEAGAALLDEDYLVLSTIHSAKGQEWTAVFLLNAVDGCIPSDMSARTDAEIEEERRLLYVAMTRAKAHLTLLAPRRFYLSHQPRRGDRHVYAARTRFIPDAILDRFDLAAWPADRQAPAGGADGPPAAIDLKARIRARW